MEQLPEAVQARSSHQIVVIIIVAAVLVASAIGGFLWAQQKATQRHARYQAARQQLDSLMQTGQNVQAARNALATAAIAYYADYKTGTDASEKRHDNAVSGSSDTDYMYAEAKAEYESASKLTDDVSQLDSAYDSIAGAFASRYGDNSVSKFRNDYRSGDEAAQDSASNWQRAIGGIKDSLEQEEEGSWGAAPADTNDLYQASDSAANRAERQWADAGSELATLQKRLDVDTAKARKVLNSLPK